MENVDPLIAKSCFRFCVVEKIFAKGAEIENWISRHEAVLPVPPYTSIDLRDSGFKAVPVDSNAFPGGFNNICPDDWPIAAASVAGSSTGSMAAWASASTTCCSVSSMAMRREWVVGGPSRQHTASRRDGGFGG